MKTREMLKVIPLITLALLMSCSGEKKDAATDTHDEKVKVKIEPGTQPGKILRLKGKGIPDVNGYGKGDLLVKVNVWIPKNLNKDEKKTIEDLKERSFLKPLNVENKKGFFRKVKDFFE